MLLTIQMLAVLVWALWSMDVAWATTDTTFAGPLGTVTGIVSGTGGQLAAALAVGAALVGSVLRFNAATAGGRGRRGHRGRGRHGRGDGPCRHGDHMRARGWSDSVKHAIPSRLDDPERWLFWTLDEAAALLGPAVLGLAANAFVTGLLAGLGAWALLRRAKRGRRRGHGDLCALLVPAGLRVAIQGRAPEPFAPLHRMRRLR